MGDEVIVRASDLPSVAIVARRQCSRCMPALLRRINRSTLLERTLLTWLGFYPWECVSCRRKRLFRDQGTRPRTPRPTEGAS